MEARKTKEDAVLDVKPLRSLAPMFPAPHGFSTTFSSSGSAPPFVCVSPFGAPSSSEGVFPPFLSTPTPSSQPAKAQAPAANGSYQVASQSPVAINLDEEAEEVIHTSSYGRKIKCPRKLSMSQYRATDGYEIEGGGEKSKSRQRKRPQKIADLSLIRPSSLDPRESVDVVLMTFDALRRRLLQLDETTDGSKRADLKAGAIMMANDLRANMGKRMGSVPGVEVGDIFYFRIEMCLVGMHAPSMAGIDYMMTTGYAEGDEPAAISIVSAGGYDNDEGDVNVLVYTGQGGGVGNRHAEKKQFDDQKLERGNLALEKSTYRGNLVRVIRTAKDMNCISGKIYIYDGLYKIQESWIDKGKSGFNVFKYKLLREHGQPEGLVVWKRTAEWKLNPSSRGRVLLPDISSGVENIPVCLVNEVDDAKGPSHFTYATSVKYLRPISSMRPLQSCRCLSVCLPGDVNCSCSQQNEGSLPYSSSGLLVNRKSVLHECNSLCSCSVNCRNRVTQKGVKLNFEVFRTRNRGWGLRSWDPIRAGTFICEYTGEVVDKIEVDDYGEQEHYNFRATYLDEKTQKWNHGPELIGEPSINQSEIFKPLPVIINAKNVGNVARFMNHSCSPNVLWQPVLYDHSEEGYPHIMFFAIKHIPPMTELAFDYGVSGDNGLSSLAGIKGPKKCLCGSPKCRGLFG